jgi:hypothetical protein
MTQTAQHTPTRRQKLLEKALEEISIGSSEKAEDYIELALAEETAAPEMFEALDELLRHVEWRRRTAGETTGPNDCTHRARAALAKAKGGAA